MLKPSRVIALVTLLCADVLAQDKGKFGYGAETDVSSAYVWRGLMLDDKPVVETSAWIDGFGLSLTAWGKLTVGATDGQTRMRASGISLAYSHNWKRLTIESGIEAYRWPDDLGNRNTIESSLGLSYRHGSFRAFGNHAVDTLTEKGAYFGEAGLAYERRIAQHTEVALQGSWGWGSSKFNDANIGVQKAAVNFLSVETSLTQYLTPHLYIRPHWTFVNIPDRRIREELSLRNFVAFGFATGFDF